MTDLDEALDTLKDRLGEAGTASEIVNDTADEYDLHPGLLRRKFEERYNTSPEDYVPSTSLSTLSRRRARKEALNWAWQSHSSLKTISMVPNALRKHQEGKDDWVTKQVRKHHLGAIFRENGYEYAFAGLSSSRAIMAIPVQGGDPTEKSAYLHQVIFQEGVEPFPWTTMQEVRPHFLGVLWLIGNPNLEFDTPQQAYGWLQEHIVFDANDDLT